MRGLLLKDLFLFKNVFKSLFFVLFFYSFFAFTNESSSFLSGMIVLVVSMLAITSFSYDERAKWDRYALTTPVTRDEIVISKYLLAFLLSFSGFAISMAMCLIIDVILKRVDVLTTLAVGAGCFEIALIYLFIMLPIVYKLGVEKLRIITLAVFFIPTILIFALYKMGIAVFNEQTLISIFKLSPVFVILLGFVSFLLSCNIYRKKDI